MPATLTRSLIVILALLAALAITWALSHGMHVAAMHLHDILAGTDMHYHG